MKTYTSFQELDALGEGLAKKYTGNTHRWNSSCFDIEGFITDFLKLPILYEAFAEDDPSKIGFLSDGITPLIVYRAGKKTPGRVPERHDRNRELSSALRRKRPQALYTRP